MLPIKIMVEEHRVIGKMLEVLKGFATIISSGDNVATEKLDHSLKFLREFVDGYHWRKEEKAFFPILQVKGVSRREMVVEVLMEDHEQGRRYVSALAGAIENHGQGQARAMTDAAEALHKYVSLLSKHIARENKTLFLLAVQMLKDADYDEIMRKFEKIERETIGKDAAARYEGIIEKLTFGVRS